MAEVTDALKEREFEVGKDEAWFANIKRTYDAYQEAELTAIKRSQNFFDQLNSLTVQHMQNAILTTHQANQQTLKAVEFTLDKQWNLEPSEAASQAEVLPKVFLDAIKAIVVEVIAEQNK